MSLDARARRVFYNPIIRKFGKKYKKLLTPFLIILGMKSIKGSQDYDLSKPSVIIVSHEASVTGAPILALNICQEISKHSNMIVILIRGGALTDEFRNASARIIQPRFGLFIKESLKHELKKICGNNLPDYAIVNSVVSAGTLQPLRSIGIPTLTLIHEFSAYIRPLEILNNISIWSSKIIFSSPLTKQDILNKCPHLEGTKIEVLPQGPCKRPLEQNYLSHPDNSKSDPAWQFLKGIDNDSLLILGAGAIQPRKGVDLFISVADQINQLCPNKSIYFVWIGSGYDPQFDFSVSLWLEDQIHRSELNDRLKILDHSTAYGDLVTRANLFLMTSRLDPLPNVAIDAMFAGKPMLCFEKACGIASLLKEDSELGQSLVSPYLNVTTMAEKAAHLIDHNEIYQKISRLCHKKANAWFDMPNYIRKLEELGNIAKEEEIYINKEQKYLSKKQPMNSRYTFDKRQFNSYSATKYYLLKWRSEVWPRKPFPGFHPGIYREHQLEGARCPDPLVHYIKAGRPEGSWQSPLITPTSSATCGASTPKTALHIHVHYPELLAELLKALNLNTIRPDLFLSYNNQEGSASLKDQVVALGFKLKELVITPNIGRDIGPLLTELGQTLDRDYAFHGHLHTKKSAQINRQQGDDWRQFLIANLVGTPGVPMTDRIITALQTDPNLGLVFPDDPTCVGWMGNRSDAQVLARRLGITSLPHAFNFPVGTMFWARKGALTPLYDLKLSWNDYPREPLDYDGTLLHAIERLLPFVAEKQGFRCGLTHVPGVSR